MANKKMIIFLNGLFLSQKEAKISLFEPAFLYGWSVFETMRLYEGKIVHFAQHIQRIRKSCRKLGFSFSYPTKSINKIILKLAKKNSLSDTYVRLTAWKNNDGAGIFIFLKEHKPYPKIKIEKGFKARIASITANQAHFLSGVKSANRLAYEISYQESLRKGFDEALILNDYGYIVEGSRSNLFFVKDKQIFTPSLNCGGLNGITRKLIFSFAQKEKIPLFEGNFTPRDLLGASEVFLTNSLNAIMPLTQVNNRIIGNGACGKITKKFIEKYNLLLR